MTSYLNGVGLLDKDLVQYMDVFAALVLAECENTLIPELYSIFGQEKMIKFIDIFSGMLIKVPNREVLNNIVRDMNIYVGMEKKGMTASTLARKYELSNESIYKIRNKVSELMRGITGGTR